MARYVTRPVTASWWEPDPVPLPMPTVYDAGPVATGLVNACGLEIIPRARPGRIFAQARRGDNMTNLNLIADASREATFLLRKFIKAQGCTRIEARYAMVMALIDDCKDAGERAALQETMANLFPAQLAALAHLSETATKN